MASLLYGGGVQSGQTARGSVVGGEDSPIEPAQAEDKGSELGNSEGFLCDSSVTEESPELAWGWGQRSLWAGARSECRVRVKVQSGI